MKVEKLAEISRKIHALSLRRDQGALRVIHDDILHVVTGCDVNDEGTAKLLRILSKELRGLNERLDQSRVVADLSDKIASLSELINSFEAQKKKDVARLKLEHTKQLSRMSAEEVHLRQSYEKALADNGKLHKDYSLNITMKDDRLTQLEKNERRLRVLLSDSETTQNKFKSNITEWKRKYDKLQRSKGEKSEKKAKNTMDSTATPPSREKEKKDAPINIDSSDAEMDTPTTSSVSYKSLNKHPNSNTNKRKSDEVLILPPSDDVDLALDEPLPSFAVKKRATTHNNTSGPKVLSISRDKLKPLKAHNAATYTAIPSNSLLALGPKTHKKIPAYPPHKR